MLAGCGSTGGDGKDASATGLKGEIHVYTRDSTSGTREAFEKGVGFEKELTKSATEVSSNDDMAAKSWTGCKWYWIYILINRF